MEIDDLIIDVEEHIRQAALEENDSLEWSENIRVDPAIWNAILDKDPELEDKAVDNIGLPEAVVDRLSRSIWSWIRFQVTFQENVSRTTLDRLKRDVYPGVCRAIANSGHAAYQDLADILDGGESLHNHSAASRIQEMFAVHWRDVFVQCPSVRIEPFHCDPDAVRRLLADAEIAK